MSRTLYHIPFFLFGLLFYLVLPIFVVMSKIWEDYPGFDTLYSYYKDEYVIGYLVLVFFIGLAYLIGAWMPLQYIKKTPPVVPNQVIVNSRGLFTLSIPLLLYCQYVIFANRELLFQGYAIDSDTPFRGIVATINMYFLFLFLYNRLVSFSKRIDVLLILVLLELLVVALGVGTRMYAMVTIFSIMTYFLDRKIIPLRKVFLWMSVIILFILAVGIWRLGDSNVTIEQLIYIGIAEPSFTWISAISMYNLNELPLFSIPYNFLSSFVNFMPSIFFPNKTELIAGISLDYVAPLGATSFLLSLISNFGIVGGLFAVFFLGFLLSSVRLYWQTAFGQAYYYCVCGMIPFQLFRDDFAIVNKGFFSNFLLLPLLIILFYRILSAIATKSEERCS